MISTQMRDVLIDHLDGQKVPILRVADVSGIEAHDRASRQATTTALIARGLLKTDGRLSAPRFTVITEAGRRILSAMLADWADALSRAEWKDPLLPKFAVRRAEAEIAKQNESPEIITP